MSLIRVLMVSTVMRYILSIFSEGVILAKYDNKEENYVAMCIILLTELYNLLAKYDIILSINEKANLLKSKDAKLRV